MIKEINEDHAMAEYASTWCVLEWPKGMTFVEFAEMLEHVGTVDGSNWEEVDLQALDDVVKYNKCLRNPPTKGKDFYWGWSPNQAGYRSQIDVFFTTEKQATYYAMVDTYAFPDSEGDMAADILSKIRQRTAAAAAGRVARSANMHVPPPNADRSGSVPTCPPKINKKAEKILKALRAMKSP